MIVIIKERECEYISDHPDAMVEQGPHDDTGWRRSKGDFKFPVAVAGNNCFIKRFSGSVDSISGWKLLESLSGKPDGNPSISKHERNIPKVYDIVNTVEKGKNINYVFLEFIEGDTLSKMLSEHIEINLEKLTESLFSAFQSLNKYGFWFADFCEKNICGDFKGEFFLVDLDSAQPISLSPHAEMWGDKEYWALVSDFYNIFLNEKNFHPQQINGLLLNYLQIIFLILRIKISQREGEDYSDLYTSLPHRLNIISPRFIDIFNRVLENGDAENFQNIITEIKDLIKEKILGTDNSVVLFQPIIKRFVVDNRSEEADRNFMVENGKSFTLRWEVEHAANTELYRNETFYKKISADKGSIEISEFYDGMRKCVEYILVVSNSCDTIRSKPLTITLIDQEDAVKATEKIISYFDKHRSKTGGTVEGQEPLVADQVSTAKEKRGIVSLVLTILIIVLISTSLIVFYFHKLNKEVDISIVNLEEYEQNVLLIFGTNLPKDSSRVEVYFNKEKARIISYSEKNIQVIVPNTNKTQHNREVKVGVVIKGDTTYAPTLLAVKKR